MVSGLPYSAPVKVLAAGAYGYGNFGDDCYVEVLRSKMAGCHLDVLTQVDESDLRLFSYDASILAGGGLLYHWVSECGTSSLKHYLRYPAIAQWLGKKSFLIGVGVQGALQKQSLVPYLNVFEGMDVRTVRDRRSAQVLRDAGVRGSVLECADLVYTKTLYPQTQVPKERPSSGKPVLGVVASQPGRRFAHPESFGFEDRIQTALRILEKDFQLHFFSFDNRSDLWLAQSWAGNYPLSTFDMKRPDAVEAFIREFGAVDAFVTTRYHGAVLSTMTGTPFVAIGAPGEKVQRECEAIQYPHFQTYDATPDRIVRSVRDMWAEKVALRDLLQRIAPQREKLALRNFDVIAFENDKPHLNASRMIPQVVDAIRSSSPQRTLVVWAAGAEAWPEASILFDSLKNFDCVLPPDSLLQHSAMDQRIRLNLPGIFNWAAFPDDLQLKLAAKYDDVVVCHAGSASKAGDLIRIGSVSGRRVWEFRLWNHSIQSISESDLASHREQVLRTQGVTA